MDEAGKEEMRKLMWLCAIFCGVEIITYALMSNYFHILVRIPEKEAADAEVTDEVLRRRVVALQGRKGAKAFWDLWEPAGRKAVFLRSGLEWTEEKQKTKAEAEWKAKRAQLLRRMHSQAEFMKLFKAPFARWYNRTNATYGTIWADRYLRAGDRRCGRWRRTLI
jgi:putative transposase